MRDMKDVICRVELGESRGSMEEKRAMKKIIICCVAINLKYSPREARPVKVHFFITCLKFSTKPFPRIRSNAAGGNMEMSSGVS